MLLVSFLLQCTPALCCFSVMLHNVWHLGGMAPLPPPKSDLGAEWMSIVWAEVMPTTNNNMSNWWSQHNRMATVWHHNERCKPHLIIMNTGLVQTMLLAPSTPARVFISFIRQHYSKKKSRTERPRKTKIGTEVAHLTRDTDSDTTFKLNRSKVNLLLMS